MTWKRWLLGTPLEAEGFREGRLRIPIALGVFSSDALSSVAYATEEILLVLSLAGAAALWYSIPISGVIVLLLAILIASYRQTIHAYPDGGGSYIGARENLGTLWGLIAAAALLLDYILTVAVSTAAGLAAMTSAFPGLLHYRVGVGLLFLFLLAVGNLRGVRQSGRIFAVPTYMFIFSMTSLIVAGIVRAWLGYPAVEPPVATFPDIQHPLNLWLLMKAFSAGCAALTGIEAVSNGVQAFRRPESRNAAVTLMIMAGNFAFFFLGPSYPGPVYLVVPRAGQTGVSPPRRGGFRAGP